MDVAGRRCGDRGGVRHQVAGGVLLALVSLPVFTTMAYDGSVTDAYCVYLMLAFCVLSLPEYVQRLPRLLDDRLVRLSLMMLAAAAFAWHYFQGPFLNIPRTRAYAVLALFALAMTTWFECYGTALLQRLFLAKAAALALTMLVVGGALTQIQKPAVVLENMPIYWHIRHFNYDIALVLGLGLGFWAAARNRLLNLVWVLLFVAAGFFSAWSGGRGQLLALLVSGALMLLAVPQARRAPAVWMAILAFGIGALLAHQAGQAELMASQLGKSVHSDSDQVSSGRVGLWIASLQRAAASPESLLFGYAPDAFSRHGIVSAMPTVRGIHFAQPHNVIIQWLLDFGIIGTALMLAWHGRVARSALRILRHARVLDVPVAAAALMLGLFVYGLTDGLFYHLIPLTFIVILCAYLSAVAPRATA